MRDLIFNRTVSLPALMVATTLSVGPAGMAMAQSDFRFGGYGPITPAATSPGKPSTAASRLETRRKSGHKDHLKTKALPVVPPGPLAIVVSIDKQRVTLFADGRPVTTSNVSTGTPGHPTPMGVFSVIQKRRHHVSNLYDAEMPFMQRLTWSGTALHQGPLPGRPASHGCIRLTGDFAQLLWGATKIGARVIVTRDEVAPAAFDMPWQFPQRLAAAESARDAMAAAEPQPAKAEAAPVKTAANGDAPEVFSGAVVRDLGQSTDEPASNTTAAAQASKVIAGDDGKIEMLTTNVSIEPAPPPAAADKAAPPVVTAPPTPVGLPPEQPIVIEELSSARGAAIPSEPVLDGQPTDPVPLPVPAPARTSKRSTDPVSVFISRKESKLYVRQKMAPLFTAPVTIADPDQPMGTHVYTAMGATDDAIRWTVISLPSNPKHPDETKIAQSKKAHGKKDRHVHVAAAEPAPLPSPRSALERIDVPPDAMERIAELLTPGSSIIVSDNKLSDETGEYTDFIVLTP